MEKEIGILQAVSIIFGVIVGSGIFVSPVGVLKYSNSVGLSLIMWTVPGLFSMLGAFVYAELGVRIQKSGGEYAYILEAFGGLPAFIVMWITFVVIGGVSCAANSLVFAEYILQPIYPSCPIPQHIITMVAICGLRHVENFQNAFEDSKYSPGELALSFYQGFWAYSGWNYLNFLTEEIKNPGRQVSTLSIRIALSLVTGLYMLTNIAYLAVLSPHEMLAAASGSSAVAVVFAQRAMPWIAMLMPIFVGASVFGSINGVTMFIPRLTYISAKEGHLPSILAMIHHTNFTPIPAVLVLLFLAIGFQFYSDLFALIELSGFTFAFIAGLAVSSLLYMRYREPSLKTSFQMPIFFPILFLFCDIFILALTIYEHPKESRSNAILMVSANVIYRIGVFWKNKPTWIQKFMHKMTVQLQKVFAVVPVEDKSLLIGGTPTKKVSVGIKLKVQPIL
ncbi:hypothetical protein Aperf_G00000069358 [Anoplocephala perfoliata]